MTPPLLPILPIITPSPIKLSSTLDLKPIDGGETALLIADLTALFIAADSLLDQPCSESPSNFLLTTPPMESPVRKLPRTETLLVEALITPPASTVKKVRFADLPLPPRISTPPGEALEDSLDMEILSRVSQELAQEQLQEADSTLRMNVPFVGLSLPVLPWDKAGDGLERLRDLKTWAGIASRKWGGAAGVGVDLSWRPFARSAVKVPTEDLGNGEVVDEVRIIPGDIEAIESGLVEGLRTIGLAKHGDKEYELEAGVFAVKTDMETLLRNKKRKAPKVQKLTQSVATGKNGVGTIRKLDGEAPLFANPLDTFMALRSRVSKKPRLSSEEVPRTIAIQGAQEQEKIPSRNIATPAPITEAPAFPRPQIHLPSSPGVFIASTTLLSQRRLFRLIRDLYPTATVIERDFTVPIIDHFAGIPSSHKDSAEADLILSTFCGLIFTSLQKIRQAPMPGQVLNTTRQRVLDVSLLYERLFVIVLGTIYGRSDSETIAGFVGFAASLRAGVNIRVLREDDDVVARWVVSTMIKEGDEGKLLEDETLWERFLRKAGFNAFAAQVVLRHCRDGGLRAFLCMSSDEKRMAFSGVVGERVMERVLERLESEWDTNT
ncbi:hypothetical protein P167DRAFT_57360 [Morchella conica CCBAS932]|uniref:Uncharacterized protein n=1 Tax=Morchella conica CCBAS932 TaxID=1392247 RepID=A0A3N4KVI7_9PEZI|nr:hypothetical protein P167DRAFT_57360 [Morchella conica CCBAS932]